VNALRLVIVDDELHARERLIRLLERERDVDVVAECSGGREAVDAVERLTPDLLLLDVQMPEMDGFGVIRAIPKDELPLVVFVTAFDRHAIEAFDVHAVDFLLKPVEAPRLMAAMQRARTRLDHESVARNQAALADVASRRAAPVETATDDDSDRRREPSAPVERFLLRQDGHLHAVAAREILWVEAQGNYARINLPNRSYMIRGTMASLERRLDRARFARIHRSAIVNLEAVRELQPWFGGDYVVILTNGARVKASRTYRSRLDRWVLG
jgi:two-component system, LytTR family, response regulator